MVSNAVIISWYTILISIVTFPLMIAILMRVKYKTKFSPFLLGLLVYFSFGVFATSVVNTLFISENRPTYSFLTGNVVTYSLYFAVVTGIMEMLGLFVAYKKILVSTPTANIGVLELLTGTGEVPAETTAQAVPS